MTIRQEMLQAAKRGAASLNPNCANSIIDYVNSLTHPDGGYRGRSAASDLYYTVFAIKLLIVLNADLPIQQIEMYLQSFDENTPLDLVHLSCLARCWANLPDKEPSFNIRNMILDRVSACRTGPTGFANQPGEQKNSIYSSFMALSAYQDLGVDMPDQDALIEWLYSQEAAEEGFAHEDSNSGGLTPITSGAIILLKHLNMTIPDQSVKWLLTRHCNEGGFFAAPLLPFPDLLSTATALHALRVSHVSVDDIREPCLIFINNLWHDHGFCGMEVDETVDCEYTFYGLLALGNLIQ
jgi:prenyltransferase beta subunit